MCHIPHKSVDGMSALIGNWLVATRRIIGCIEMSSSGRTTVELYCDGQPKDASRVPEDYFCFLTRNIRNIKEGRVRETDRDKRSPGSGPLDRTEENQNKR
jgi:hypothetical protein